MEASRPKLSHGWCIDGCCLPQPSDYVWGAQPTSYSPFRWEGCSLLLVPLIPLGSKNSRPEGSCGCAQASVLPDVGCCTRAAQDAPLTKASSST